MNTFLVVDLGYVQKVKGKGWHLGIREGDVFVTIPSTKHRTGQSEQQKHEGFPSAD